MLSLDSDGVFAGWRKYVFSKHILTMSPEEFNKLPEIRRRGILRDIYLKDPDLFYNLEPIAGTERILEAADTCSDGWGILTSSSEDHQDYNHVVECKHAWFKKHFDVPATRITVVENSAAKQQYAGRGHLLVDDFRRNCNQWALAGGFALWTKTDAPSVDAIVEQLRNYQEDPNLNSGMLLLLQ
ncbi:hypothetical protein pEaSNUABM11_00279 [Erwinia phage pEa_SNUABM_11]|nr:hypothetical protein pEaSNUABM11_00279 [Erwinia phage pEa_SNUABM_11]